MSLQKFIFRSPKPQDLRRWLCLELGSLKRWLSSFRHFSIPPWWYAWTSWQMLSRAATMPVREANTRFFLGSASKSPSGFCDDEACLHWWIWNDWWSQRREDCCDPDGQAKHAWSDQPQTWCTTQRSRKMAGWSAPALPIWFQCTNNLSWHRGPWRSEAKTHRRENPRIPFLGR